MIVPRQFKYSFKIILRITKLLEMTLSKVQLQYDVESIAVQVRLGKGLNLLITNVSL